MRNKPENGDNFNWNKFENYIDDQNIGTIKDDWISYWYIWVCAYKTSALDILEFVMKNQKECCNATYRS